MKKTIHLLVLLLFVSGKSSAYNEKDSTAEVRNRIFAEAGKYGHDPVLAAQAFDFIVKLFKIKAIYLDSTKTGMSHYSILKRTLRINVRNGRDSMTYKVFGELTHAVQFTWRPFYYTKNALTVFTKTFFKAVFWRDRERYRQKVDSVRRYSPQRCSKLRAAFIAIYLRDAYCNETKPAHEDCDVESFEHQHPEIEGALWRLYYDLIFLLQYLHSTEVKEWLKIRKRQIYKDLRQQQRSFFFISGTIGI